MTDTEQKTLTPMVIEDSGSFSYNVYGWNITTPPPAITAAGHFATTPSPLIKLGDSTCQVVPTQTSTATNTSGPNLKYVSTNGTLSSFWGLENGNNISYNLEMPSPVNVELTLVLAASSWHGVPQGGVAVAVNGHMLYNEADTNGNWHSLTVTIPADIMVAGNNSLVIAAGGNMGEWIQSVQVSSENVPLKASYYWQQIAASELYPGDTFDRSIAVTNGSTSTNSETTTFGTTVGVSVSVGGVGATLLGISAKLSASFSYSHSSEHSIAISEQTTSSYGVNITPPKGDDSLTFQVWQLCLQYDANGSLLNQVLGPDHGPILITQFPT